MCLLICALRILCHLSRFDAIRANSVRFKPILNSARSSPAATVHFPLAIVVHRVRIVTSIVVHAATIIEIVFTVSTRHIITHTIRWLPRRRRKNRFFCRRLVPVIVIVLGTAIIKTLGITRSHRCNINNNNNEKQKKQLMETFHSFRHQKSDSPE